MKSTFLEFNQGETSNHSKKKKTRRRNHRQICHEMKANLRMSLKVDRNFDLKQFEAITPPFPHSPFLHTSTALYGDSLQILTSCRQGHIWWWPALRWTWVLQKWGQSSSLTQAPIDCGQWCTCSEARCTQECNCRPDREICEYIPKVNLNQHVHVQMKQHFCRS